MTSRDSGVVIRTSQGSLKNFFGAPVKPFGSKPTAKDQKWTAAYGGIFKNQALYCLEEEAAINLAMIWPWTDGMLLTVKIIQEPKT